MQRTSYGISLLAACRHLNKSPDGQLRSDPLREELASGAGGELLTDDADEIVLRNARVKCLVDRTVGIPIHHGEKSGRCPGTSKRIFPAGIPRFMEIEVDGV